MSENLFQSKRLCYRLFKESDYDDLLAIFGSDLVCRYLPIQGHLDDEAVLKRTTALSRMNETHELGVIYAAVYQGKVIGYAGIMFIKEYDKYEIMYGLNPGYWKQGFGKEMALMMKEKAKQRQLNNVIAFAHPDNLPSHRILKAIGYRKIKQTKLWGLDLNYYEMEL